MPIKDPEKRRQYQRNYYRNNAARADKLKEERGNACEKCGYNKEPRILEFHHRNPEEKLFYIPRAWTRSEKAIRLEAEKCDLLCPNCHEIEHLKPCIASSPSGYGNGLLNRHA